MTSQTTRTTLLALLTLLLPAALLLYIRQSALNDTLWTLPLFHFYIVTFTSFVALVAAIFIGVGVLEQKLTFRNYTLTLAFGGMAAFFVLHGLATPGILLPGPNQAVVWSATLSLVCGAFFFAASSMPLPQRWQEKVLQHGTNLRRILIVFYLLYALIAFFYPQPLASISAVGGGNLPRLIASISIALYALSAWRYWQSYRATHRILHSHLALAAALLAEAQISMTWYAPWQISWWLYHFLMLTGYSLAVFSVAREYESVRTFRPARYFAALGSIVAAAIALSSGEILMRLIQHEAQRWQVIVLSLSGSLIFFLLLYLIVARADQIIHERTAALKREQQMRAELTNLIIHDLKNPLSAILGSLELLPRIAPLNKDQTHMVENGLNAAKTMLNLINDILDVERLEGGKLEIRPQPIDLADFLSERIAAIHVIAEKQRQKINLHVAPDLPTIAADAGLLARVIDNLLGNALKYAGQSEIIRVRAQREANQVRIQVIDQGPGIPPEMRTRIFEKFVQMQGSERRGTGLGLAFSKMVIEAHGGRIWVEDNPAGGAIFNLTLPANATDEPMN